MSAFQVLYGKITQKNDIDQFLSPYYTFFVYSLNINFYVITDLSK